MTGELTVGTVECVFGSVLSCVITIAQETQIIVAGVTDLLRQNASAIQDAQNQLVGALEIVGGTYFDRDAGLIGTAFLYNPVKGFGTVSFVGITSGLTGWNSRNTFRCSLFQPPGTARNRSMCWLFTAPLSGRYDAVASIGSQAYTAHFTIDAAAKLDAPQITSVNASATQVSIQWGAPVAARSFVVRVNPLPFAGVVSSEKAVSGGIRSATLSGLSLVSGAQYQAVVFAFDKDVVTATDAVTGSFNISAHGVVFTAP